MSRSRHGDHGVRTVDLRSMKRFELRIGDWGLRITGTLFSSQIRNPQSAIRNQSGFTLLEIIIVITILSVLTAAAIPMVRNSVRREREAELRLALRTLRQALDRYKAYNDLSQGAPYLSSGRLRADIRRSSSYW